MKILLVSSVALPTPAVHYGGLEQVVSDLAGELVKRGHAVSVACTHDSHLPPGVEHIPTIDTGVFNLLLEKQAFEAYRGKLGEFDIVDDHSHAKYSYLAAEHTAKIIGSIHDRLPFASAPPGWDRPCFVARSKAHADALKNDLERDAEYVYNGVDPARFPYKEEKGDRFIFLSRIEQGKGALQAIKAAKELGVGLDVVGEDITITDQAYVHQVMRACDGRQVRYWGRVPQDLKVELLQNAKALISPLQAPYFEVFGLHLIEALLCGTPVIVNWNGASSELVEDGVSGFLTHTLAGVQTMMVHLVHHDQPGAFCIDPKACRVQGEKFSVAAMADRYLELYGRVQRGERW